MCPGVGLEVGLRCFAHLFVVLSAVGHAQYPAFAPDTQFLLPALQKWQLGFVYFVSFGLELAPPGHAHGVIFSPG